MAAGNSQAFEHLHSLLQQIHDAEYVLSHGPRRIAAAQKKVAAAEQACSAQKEHILELKKQADSNSLNLKSREAEIEKLSGQLNQAASNKEYDIIQGQIATKKEADAALEDSILELLSDVDDASDKLQQLEDELAELVENSKSVSADVKAREPGLQAEVERLRAEIAEAEKVITGGEARSTYKRLKEAQGPTALAAVEDGYCSECNTNCTPQDQVRLNMGEFVLCRACGRILYLSAAAEA